MFFFTFIETSKLLNLDYSQMDKLLKPNVGKQIYFAKFFFFREKKPLEEFSHLGFPRL